MSMDEGVYYILSAYKLTELCTLVDVWLQYGWTLVGGPFVFNGEVCQAVVKKEVASDDSLL
jgi:hypothetical protein